MNDNDRIAPKDLHKYEPVTRHLGDKMAGVTFYAERGQPILKIIDSLAEVKRYKIRDFYKPELIEQALTEVLKSRGLETVATKDLRQAIKHKSGLIPKNDRYAKMVASLQANTEAVADYFSTYLDSYLVETLKPTLKTEQEGGKSTDELLSGTETKRLIPLTDGVYTSKNGSKTKQQGYTVPDQKALEQFIKGLLATDHKERKIGTISESELQQGSTSLESYGDRYKAIRTLGEASGINLGEQPEQDKGTITINTAYITLESILHKTLYQMVQITKAKPVELKPVERDKDTQLELFSNIKMGVDTAEIIARHQFYNPLYRGYMEMGEQGIYEAVTKAKQNSEYEIAIPYKTTGSTSVYKASMQLGVSISGVDVTPISDLADAKRLQARLHKAHGMLSLWAMETNSNALYNVKMTDLLRLAGYTGRIKPDDYIDVTQGIIALVAQTITRGSDTHYTDPKTGKAIKLGKNELYGDVIRPVGSLGAVWHTGYAKNAKGKRIQTGKDPEGKPIYKTEPKYIKKIVHARLADGMLNPTQKRATIISKSLLQLNTLQERYYWIMGICISETYSQHDKQTAQGKPIKLTIQTLLEWRGLNDPESLRRVDRTKTQLKDALDRLTEIGHIAKWQLKGGAKYADISLDPSGLQTVVEIYPPEHIQQVLRPAIADPNSKLTNLVKQDVREYGITKVAEMYQTTPEAITAVINNQDTVDSLPSLAYNDLKARQYDKNQDKGKYRKTRKAS